MRKVSRWGCLMAAAALLAAGGCKSATSASPTAANNNPVNGSGTRSGLIAGSDPTSLNTKTPPPGPDLYVATARVYEKTDNVEGAKAQYAHALKVDPAYLPALLGYAHLLDTQKEFDGADKYYQQAAKKHSQVAAVFNDWGMSQQRRGHLEESAKLLTKATRLAPEKQLYRNNLAMVLVVMHRPQEAYYQLSQIESPAVAHFNLAALLHRDGDERLAAYHFAQASKEDPSWAQAREWAARLSGAAPMATSALAVSGDARVPPPDPRPDPAAAAYEMASRAPIVEQANALPPPATTPLPPAALPEQTGSYYAPAGNTPAADATTSTNLQPEPLPPLGTAEPGPVTPTSGVAYPAQYPTVGSPTAARAESSQPLTTEALPPLPPSGPTASDPSAGAALAPLPPMR